MVSFSVPLQMEQISPLFTTWLCGPLRAVASYPSMPIIFAPIYSSKQILKAEIADCFQLIIGLGSLNTFEQDEGRMKFGYLRR
jgi:hypothetical protein